MDELEQAPAVPVLCLPPEQFDAGLVDEHEVDRGVDNDQRVRNVLDKRREVDLFTHHVIHRPFLTEA